MGAREGTAPEDDPLILSQSVRARMKGHAEGRSKMLVANVLTVLKARGIEVTSNQVQLRDLLGALSGDAAMEAAMACTDATDFRRRIRE